MNETTERLALRAVLTAARLLGLAAGMHLRQLRGRKDPLTEAHSRLQEAQLQARVAWEIVDMLLVRFSKTVDPTVRATGSAERSQFEIVFGQTSLSHRCVASPTPCARRCS